MVAGGAGGAGRGRDCACLSLLSRRVSARCCVQARERNVRPLASREGGPTSACVRVAASGRTRAAEARSKPDCPAARGHPAIERDRDKRGVRSQHKTHKLSRRRCSPLAQGFRECFRGSRVAWVVVSTGSWLCMSLSTGARALISSLPAPSAAGLRASQQRARAALAPLLHIDPRGLNRTICSGKHDVPRQLTTFIIPCADRHLPQIRAAHDQRGRPVLSRSSFRHPCCAARPRSSWTLQAPRLVLREAHHPIAFSSTP
jgi:hypothetical protein